MGVQLRNMGTTGTYAPITKRATARLSTGRSVLVVPDTNLATGVGDDVTGVAKIYVYLSTDANRTAYTLVQTFTPPVAMASATQAAVMTITVRENDELSVFYQGVDNSLHLATFAFSAGTYGAGVDEVVIAASAVTNRFRAIDADSVPTNLNRAIVVYEANASTGQGAWVRVYLKNNASTWIKVWEHQIFTTEFIKAGGEDVSLAWNKAGIVGGLGQIAVYYTRTHTAGDLGDYVREISVDPATVTTNSATNVGTWFSNLNKDLASGTRRGWMYAEGSNQWMFGTTVGLAIPQFIGMRLTHNVFTGVVQNKSSVTVQQASTGGRRIPIDRNPNTCMAADYSDGRLVFAFAGIGTGLNNYAARAVVMRFSETLSNKVALSTDSVARFLDQAYSIGQGVLGIYGGASKNCFSGLYDLNFFVMYGYSGNTAGQSRLARAVMNDILSAPTVVAPVANPAIDLPTLIAQERNSTLYSNALAKPQWQLATDGTFTTDLRTVDDGGDYKSYSSTDGATQPTRVISYKLPAANQLFGNTTWYIRARMRDDLGSYSSWSAIRSFFLSHPPTATPLRPRQNESVKFLGGSILFSWNFSDTEPTDTQTAYQLVVERLDTGGIVLDTGKVLSSTKWVKAVLSVTLLDIPLQWRVSLWDGDNVQGSFSNSTFFTLVNPPIVKITTPTDGSTVTTALPTIQWVTTVGGTRTQKAYRVTVVDTDFVPNVTVGDSGWVVGADNTYSFPARILNNTKNYKVKVEVQDSTGLYASNESVINSNPNFELDTSGWIVADGGILTRDTSVVHGGLSASGKYTPPGAVVTLYVNSEHEPVLPNVRYVADGWVKSPVGWLDLMVSIDWFDSGDVKFATSSGTTTVAPAGVWTQLPFPVATSPVNAAYGSVKIRQGGTPAATDVFYMSEVTLKQDPTNFVTNWIEPAAAAATVVSDKFKVTISWTNATLDPDFIAWRVYRRYMKTASVDLDVNNTANTWELIYETNDNGAAVQYNDYLMPLNKLVDYVVVQVVDRFGSILESDILAWQTITVVVDRYYLIPEIPVGAIASFEASSVVADSFTREVEQETLHVIGRGRQVQIGDDLGYTGTLTFKLRNSATARRDREFLELLASDDVGNVYLKSPFGDVLYVAFGNISSSRVPGVGTTDMTDVTVPYSEVFNDAPITRLA